MIHKKSVSQNCSFWVVLSIILAMVVFLASSANAQTYNIYTFDPANQKYELYDGSLCLWEADSTGHSPLSASIADVDRGTLRAWLGMIMAAHAMGKQVVIQYETATGKIVSVYGPK